MIITIKLKAFYWTCLNRSATLSCCTQREQRRARKRWWKQVAWEMAYLKAAWKGARQGLQPGRRNEVSLHSPRLNWCAVATRLSSRCHTGSWKVQCTKFRLVSNPTAGFVLAFNSVLNKPQTCCRTKRSHLEAYYVWLAPANLPPEMR